MKYRWSNKGTELVMKLSNKLCAVANDRCVIICFRSSEANFTSLGAKASLLDNVSVKINIMYIVQSF